MIHSIKLNRALPLKSTLFLCMTCLAIAGQAQEDRVELDTTVIKGNTELPKILYVVPWKDLDGKVGSQQKLTLHSLFGDLFDPVSPVPPRSTQEQSAATESQIPTE